MNGDEARVVVVFLIASAVTIVSIAKMYIRRLEIRDRARSTPLAGAVDDRLNRIEQAVDAIAVEVERMSEGQRFTTKLLAERLSDVAAVPRSAAGRNHDST